MDNETILSNLTRDARGDEERIEDDDVVLKYLVFTLDESLYALNAEDVREITSSNDMYYVPFVPPYVRGYANRHGQPYTVFDVQMLFEGRPMDSTTLLVLKSTTDQLALLISDVKEIVRIPQRNTFRITSQDESARYFQHALNLDEREVFVLNVETLLERLERDLERA